MSKLILINSGGSYTAESVSAVPVVDAGSPVQASTARTLVLINASGTYTVPVASMVLFEGSVGVVAAVSSEKTLAGPIPQLGNIVAVAKSSYTQAFGGVYRYSGFIGAVTKSAHNKSRLSGRSLVPWQYKPAVGYTEILEFKTDVLRTKNKEQRLSLRNAPRRFFDLSYNLNADAFSAAKMSMRYATSFLMPDWAIPSPASGISIGAVVPITVDMSNWDVVVGDSIFLWTGSGNYQIVKVSAIQAYGFDAVQVTIEQGTALAYPMLPAICPSGLEFTRRTPNSILARAVFQITKNSNKAATPYASYRGHDVMTDPPVIGVSQMRESIIYPVSVIDNELGTPVLVNRRALPDETFSLSWYKNTVAGVAVLRNWVHSRYGKHLAFWSSTYNKDFELAETIGPSATTITVMQPMGMGSLDRTAFDIEIVTSTTIYYVQITNAVKIGDSTINLTIPSALGATITPANVNRISILRCGRFDSDRVEFKHNTNVATSVIIPCIEVPVP